MEGNFYTFEVYSNFLLCFLFSVVIFCVNTVIFCFQGSWWPLYQWRYVLWWRLLGLFRRVGKCSLWTDFWSVIFLVVKKTNSRWHQAWVIRQLRKKSAIKYALSGCGPLQRRVLETIFRHYSALKTPLVILHVTPNRSTFNCGAVHFSISHCYFPWNSYIYYPISATVNSLTQYRARLGLCRLIRW